MDCPRCDGPAIRYNPTYGYCLSCGLVFLLEDQVPDPEETEDQDYESRASETADRTDGLP